MVYLGLWYLASLVTLFINKHVLSNGINAQVLAVVQMTTTCVMGAAKVYSSRSPKKGKEDMFQSPLFFKRMFFVGIMRFSTVVLGLVSLKFVPVSFTETIKSSAPFFTVLFAWVILRESTSTLTKVALVPIAGGLALASATELEFHIIGFMAAVMNNCVDCIQNVYSKKLLSMMTFVELQFYTSLAAIIIQIPMWVGTSMYMGGVSLSKMNIRSEMIGWLAIDATSYHLQSVFAYALMSQISPVTHSVANTVKRSLLIWLSIMFFGNAVTFASCFGTALVVAGVFFYNYARQSDAKAKLAAAAARPKVEQV
eukprot:g5010.t1